MAKPEAKSTKKKSRTAVIDGIAFIHASFNNTIIKHSIPFSICYHNSIINFTHLFLFFLNGTGRGENRTPVQYKFHYNVITYYLTISSELW